MPPQWRNQIDSVLDCQFGDLIRLTTPRRSQSHVGVLPKQLQSVKPAAVQTIEQVVADEVPQRV